MHLAKYGFLITNRAGSFSDTASALGPKSSITWRPRSARFREKQRTLNETEQDTLQLPQPDSVASSRGDLRNFCAYPQRCTNLLGCVSSDTSIMTSDTSRSRLVMH